MSNPETWIIYKTETMSDEGWEDRKLMPSQSLADVLSEEWDWSGKDFPQVGSRFREYENLDDPGNGASHGKDGDWVVTKIHQFISLDTEQRIMVCYCSYQPIEPNWEKMKRLKPLVEAV